MLAALSKKTRTAKAVYQLLQQRRSLFGSLARNIRGSTTPVEVVTAPSCCEFYGFTNETRCRRRGFSSASSAAAVASNDASGSRDNLPQPITTTEQLPTKLIDFETQAKIEGEESHVAMIQLRPGEVLRAEAGAMLFMTEGVVMDTKMNGASSALNRFMTGQNLFLTDFHYEGTESGTVGLGTDFPSKILRFSLSEFPNSTLICQKGAYLASNPHVQIEMEFTKTLTAGFFGGEGFVLQKLSGQGDVLIKGGGTVVERYLEAGQTLRVSSGSLIAFEPTIEYNVQMMPGIRNVMFGGEGLFVTTLQGPGRLWLQGLPPDRMIAEIARRVPGGPGIGLGVPIGIGGGGGEAAAGGEVAADAAAGATAGGMATEAAIDADRQATVASSGISSSSSPSGGETTADAAPVDADSPSALFGDAVTPDVNPVTASSSPAASIGNDTASSATMSTEKTFSDDGTIASSQQQNDFDFDDDTSFSSSSTPEPQFDQSNEFDSINDNFEDGQLFDGDSADSSSTENNASATSGEDEGGGLLQTLWDYFTSDE